MKPAVPQPKHVAPDVGERLHVLGDNIRILVSSTETGGSLSVVETNTQPGEGPPLHIHTREDETFVVMEGNVEFTVGGTVFVAEPGHFVFGPRGIPHRFLTIGDQPARMIVTLSPGGFEERFFRAVSEKIGKNPPDMGLIMKLAEESGLQFVK